MRVLFGPANSPLPRGTVLPFLRGGCGRLYRGGPSVREGVLGWANPGSPGYETYRRRDDTAGGVRT